ncbi:MAG: Ig-like domain-containing protein [Planctomycetota bacterium]|nr:Ig-like domain-containing protein [Planctomycetota bacterium]
MLVRKLTLPTLLLAIVGLAGCSGGTAGGTASPSCTDEAAFCLVSCNLGCTITGGCAVTDIAQNQPLVFSFSQDVDPLSVDFTTFSLKTSSGLEPVGEFVVNGSTVTFVPEVRTVQGQTFFGFDANAEYVLSLTGGPNAPAALVSTAGDRLASDYRCNLRVSRGVIDLDQRPPTARLVTPAVTTGASRNTAVVLEFSELIDGTSFFNSTGEDAPVIFRVGRPANGVCDANILLNGSPRLENDTIRGVTILTFRPPTELPAESCMRIEVTARVRDLAGTRATRQSFQFLVESGSVSERALEFSFDNDLQLDRGRSGGDWLAGEATFATVGGDGRHGEFRLEDGQRVTAQHFIWNTDSQLLTKKEDSFLNEEVTVTDGRYFFSTFELRAGQTLEFQGSRPAQIFVRGECIIDGQILGNGEFRSGGHNGRNSASGAPGEGQVGSAAGPGGGKGGNGAWGSDGLGDPTSPNNVATYNSFNGYDGEDLNLPAGHAYSGQEVGTGGRGSVMWPAHGNQLTLIFGGIGSDYAVEAVSGAGGAGFLIPGTNGVCLNAGATTDFPPFPNTTPAHRGPNGAGGSAFPLLSFPSNLVSSNYFLVGGAGGGGGGSQATFARRSATTDPFKYRSGGGGAGGGGAILVRSGANLSIGALGRVEAKGGACAPSADSNSLGLLGVPSPGGGGSGGSILLQTGRNIAQSGTLDVRGGNGATNVFVGFFLLNQSAGNGSPGFVRLERAGSAPSLADLGTTLPAATTDSVGLLEEQDQKAGFQSVFASTGEVFPPIYARYEIDALIDGQPVLFSDDPAVSARAALPGEALQFFVQALQVDPVTGEPDPNDRPTNWVRYVGDFGGATSPGLAGGNAKNGVRILMLIDRAQAQQVVVQSVRIIYRA